MVKLNVRRHRLSAAHFAGKALLRGIAASCYKIYWQPHVTSCAWRHLLKSKKEENSETVAFLYLLRLLGKQIYVSKSPRVALHSPENM